MKANDFRSKCSELEMNCLPIGTMNKYVHLIITELMDPFKKLKTGEWEWKNGMIYQFIKKNVRVVCLSYYRGAMSFYIEYNKSDYNYYAIWSLKVEAEKEDDEVDGSVKNAFDEVCKYMMENQKEMKGPYSRLKIGKNEVDKYITMGSHYKDASFGCDSISIDDLSEFLRTLDDLHLIKLYIDELDN